LHALHWCCRICVEAIIERSISRVAFGKPIINLGGNRERIADFRIAIDQARLLTLFAAWKLDTLARFGA
jgi:acyl-CoA dehydrogenase